MGVRLEPWGPADLPLLEQCLADPVMTEHVGGPETPAKIAERQQRYERPDSGQFRIVAGEDGSAGWVGYWDREWLGQPVYETGWAVIPAFQRRGLASAGMAALCAHLREHGERRYLHAYPSVDNGPSNGVCAKLGFELLGECAFEYPKGHLMNCNDWRLDLHAEA